MSVTDGDLVDRMAKKHSVSPEAVQVVLTALRSGGGRMAQFSHADFGGMSQWSPGMSMVGDMFNTQLKAKLEALCTDIAAHLDLSETAGGARGARAAAGDEVSYRSTERSSNWWPAGLGRPGAVGAQNDLQYAVFPEARRLVIDDQRFPFDLRHRPPPDFRRRPSPKRRSNADVHQPGWAGQDCGSAESKQLTVPRVRCVVRIHASLTSD
jgi:hypothetical protein